MYGALKIADISGEFTARVQNIKKGGLFMDKKESDFYQKLRNKIRIWSNSKAGKLPPYFEYLLAAPDLFHLLCKLSIDKDVPVKEKVKLAGVIAYFISPIDIIPDIIGPFGYIDDIVLAALALNSFIKSAGKTVVRKHWAGEEDIIALIERILEIADEMVGGVLWKKVKKWWTRR